MRNLVIYYGDIIFNYGDGDLHHAYKGEISNAYIGKLMLSGFHTSIRFYDGNKVQIIIG